MQKFLFIIIVFISACTSVLASNCPWKDPNDLLIKDFAALQGNIQELPSAQVQDDLECLKLAFQKQYVASHFFSSQGIDLVKRVSDFSNALISTLDQKLLLQRLLELHQDAFDSHLMYSFYAKNGPLNKMLPAYAIFYVPRESIPKHTNLKSCKYLDRQKALELNGKATYQAFVGQFSLSSAIPETVTCTTEKGELLELPLKRRQPESLSMSSSQFSFMLLEGNILLIRIPRFSADISEQLNSLIPILADSSHEYRLLFDLRQNPGGSDAMVKKLGQILRIHSEKGHDTKVTDMESLYSIASQTNSAFLSWQWAIQNGKPPAPFKKSYEQILKYFEELVASGKTLSNFKITTQIKSGSYGTREGIFHKPIVMLIDKGCASACDGMIAEFSNLPQTTIIGVNSYGAVHFGNQGTLKLPNSNVLVSSGWRQFDFTEISVKEGVGFTPDFYVLEQNSLATAINYLRNRE